MIDNSEGKWGKTCDKIGKILGRKEGGIKSELKKKEIEKEHFNN